MIEVQHPKGTIPARNINQARDLARYFAALHNGNATVLGGECFEDEVYNPFGEQIR